MYMNKKRKFQDEQLGLSKHKSFNGTITFGLEQSRCNENPESGEVYMSIKMDSVDESYDQDSAEGSNSFDSVSKTEMVCENLSTGSSLVTCVDSPESGESDLMVKNLGLQSYIDYEKRMLKLAEFELKNEGIEEFYSEKEIEDLYSNDANGNKFLLSSGRWGVGQETERGTENLTIDKEFEEYFSMLML